MRDIFLSIPFAFGITVLVKAWSAFIFNERQMSWLEVVTYGSILSVIWIVNEISKQALVKVEVDVDQDKVTFVLQRYFKVDLMVDFSIISLSLETTMKPSRFVSKNMILTIRDEVKELKISSAGNGLSEMVLAEIKEKLIRYAEHKNRSSC